MPARLKNILDKAITFPDAYPDLKLGYTHGHELSGMVEFDMTFDGRFKLTNSIPPWEKPTIFSGQMDASQRRLVLEAIQSSRLWDIQSSARIAAEDEIPTVVEINFAKLSHRLLVWKNDEPKNQDLVVLETHLQQVFDQLSNGLVRIDNI